MRRWDVFMGSCVIGFLALASCREPEPFPESQYDKRLSGGSNTVFDNTAKAFGNPFPDLGSSDLFVHELGDKQFEAIFVTPPALVNPGLGPLYNNVSCVSCHHNDGIGVPTAGEAQSSLLLRISLPGIDEHGGPLPVPGYGTQVQDKAVFGRRAEAQVAISYSYQEYTFADGEPYELRAPTYTLAGLSTPIDGTFLLSPRLAPPVFGLGLLEAVPEYEILAHVLSGDSGAVHGKANYVWDPVSRSVMLGRFGWKANVATILTQVAMAYNQDIGITTSIFPQEGTTAPPNSDSVLPPPELSDRLLQATRFYVQTLAVPARRNAGNLQVLHGEALFQSAKCSSCHLPTLTTGVSIAFPALSNQRIHPYTDLLLHDMGEGLADGRPDYLASGSEWRTAPLWGIGLVEVVNYPAYYLHDGRARTLVEAIMWHGGEAEPSKEFFGQLSKADRDAIIAFLKSL